MKIATAESFTSGRIAAEFTKESGASKFFAGGLVCYQTDVKVNVLGVPQELIDKYGVVSEEVVKEMVRRACDFFGADYAAASTGYAEAAIDEGAPEPKMWIAWGTKDDIITQKYYIDRGREKNVQFCAEQAYLGLKTYIANIKTSTEEDITRSIEKVHASLEEVKHFIKDFVRKQKNYEFFFDNPIPYEEDEIVGLVHKNNLIWFIHKEEDGFVLGDNLEEDCTDKNTVLNIAYTIQNMTRKEVEKYELN